MLGCSIFQSVVVRAPGSVVVLSELPGLGVWSTWVVFVDRNVGGVSSFVFVTLAVFVFGECLVATLSTFAPCFLFVLLLLCLLLLLLRWKWLVFASVVGGWRSFATLCFWVVVVTCVFWFWVVLFLVFVFVFVFGVRLCWWSCIRRIRISVLELPLGLERFPFGFM